MHALQPTRASAAAQQAARQQRDGIHAKGADAVAAMRFGHSYSRDPPRVSAARRRSGSAAPESPLKEPFLRRSRAGTPARAATPDRYAHVAPRVQSRPATPAARVTPTKGPATPRPSSVGRYAHVKPRVDCRPSARTTPLRPRATNTAPRESAKTQPRGRSPLSRAVSAAPSPSVSPPTESVLSPFRPTGGSARPSPARHSLLHFPPPFDASRGPSQDTVAPAPAEVEADEDAMPETSPVPQPQLLGAPPLAGSVQRSLSRHRPVPSNDATFAAFEADSRPEGRASQRGSQRGSQRLSLGCEVIVSPMSSCRGTLERPSALPDVSFPFRADDSPLSEPRRSQLEASVHTAVEETLDEAAVVVPATMSPAAQRGASLEPSPQKASLSPAPQRQEVLQRPAARSVAKPRSVSFYVDPRMADEAEDDVADAPPARRAVSPCLVGPDAAPLLPPSAAVSRSRSHVLHTAPSVSPPPAPLAVAATGLVAAKGPSLSLLDAAEQLQLLPGTAPPSVRPTPSRHVSRRSTPRRSASMLATPEVERLLQAEEAEGGADGGIPDRCHRRRRFEMDYTLWEKILDKECTPARRPSRRGRSTSKRARSATPAASPPPKAQP